MRSAAAHRIAASLILAAACACGALWRGAIAADDVHSEGDPAQAPAAGSYEELDQRLRILERLREIESQEAAEARGKASTAAAGPEGFQIRSADGAHVLKLRGYIHSDARYDDGDDETEFADTFLLRRIRPAVEGTLYGRFDFRIMPEFGEGRTVLQDGYIDARVKPWVRVRVGKFKSPFGLERLQSATEMLFVERALPTNLVPNRDTGLMLHGDVGKGLFAWAVGVFNGAADGGSTDVDATDGKDTAARLFVQPFRRGGPAFLGGLGVGVAFTRGNDDGRAGAPGLASYRTQGQQTFFSFRTAAPGVTASLANTVVARGRRERVSPQAWYHVGPFGLLGESVRSSHEVSLAGAPADLEQRAWQATGSWLLTGERSANGPVVPRRPLDPGAKGWGALQIVARVARLDVDDDAFPVYADSDIAARGARSWGAGANWYLNRSVKVALNYERSRFEGGAPLGGDRAEEAMVFGRLQISY